jgi:hypothetical protein
MNPFDVLPANARRFVYAALGLAAIALAAYKAANGDWIEFAGLLLGSLGFGQATAKTVDVPPADPAPAERPFGEGHNTTDTKEN